MRRRADGRRQRGAALVEAALALPLVLLIVFGIVEAGLALRDSNVLSRSVQASARTGARVADGRTADYEVLRALQSGLSAVKASSISRVVIYDATADASVPTNCRTVPRPNDLSAVGFSNCNVYSRLQVTTDDPTGFDGAGCAGDWDVNFCPSGRTRDGDTPTRLGVWVELDYDNFLPLVPSAVSLTERAIFQLEPCVAGDPTC